MELIILAWIIIAHCIYISLAVNSTNNVSPEVDLKSLLSEQYAMCLFWPFMLFFGVTYMLFVGITELLILKNKVGEYLMEIYWDIMAFYDYVQNVRNTDKKP